MTRPEQVVVKEAPLTSEAAKALLILSVADETGFRKIPYELLHSTVFYLQAVHHFNFPGYTFTPFSRPGYGTAFISEELAADIGMLRDRGLMLVEGDSHVCSITDRGRAAAQQAIPALKREGKSYYEFQTTLIGALGTTRAYFLRMCYRAYIDSFQSSALK